MGIFKVTVGQIYRFLMHNNNSRTAELIVAVLLWLTKARWCSYIKVPRAALSLSVAMHLSQS